MANEIVRYSNAFNGQALRRFNAAHLNLLMAIVSKVRDQGTNTVQFTLDSLKQISGLQSYKLSTDEFIEKVKAVNERLLSCHFAIETDTQYIQFSLFNDFVIDKPTGMLTVKVHERFAFLLNDLTSNFTRFELQEFTSLHSSYSKECYRRLKQYRKTGLWAVSFEEFRRLLDVPETYNMTSFNTRVLKPIIEELTPLLDLKLEKIYEKKHRGPGRTSLTKLIFSFNTEPSAEQIRVDSEWAKQLEELNKTSSQTHLEQDDEQSTIDSIEEFKDAHNGRTPFEEYQFQHQQASQ